MHPNVRLFTSKSALTFTFKSNTRLCLPMMNTHTNINNNTNNNNPSIDSPVLKKVYPQMLEHISLHGHPNIPLGNSDGRACHTLRRLYVKKELSDNDLELLQEMQFRFSFDDIYEQMDFEEMVGRLLAYEDEFRVNFQIPKKYAPDPELGAWVAAVRRIGPSSIDALQRERLDGIKFAWVSTRKCGSQFMDGYRGLKMSFIQELGCNDKYADTDFEKLGMDKALEYIMQFSDKDEFVYTWQRVFANDSKSKKWLRSQRETHKKGILSDLRVQYMDQLHSELGLDWMSFEL